MGLRLLDCANHKADCKTSNQIVQANPDVAGIGVILGFLATTSLAFLIALTVLFLDHYDGFMTTCRKVFTKNKEEYVTNVDGPYWRSPLFWSKVLSKNLLAFSDTQLLTGLAIQFTAMLLHCELTVYHFQIVTELAFLTTVTHLLTVVVLRDYFVKNRWINLPRILFMLANLALLGYTSFVAYSYDLVHLELSSSLTCFFQQARPELDAAIGSKWGILLVLAIGGHVTVIAAMYILKEEKLKKGEWSFKWVGAWIRTWIIAPTYAIYGMYMAGANITKTQALGQPNVTIEGSEKEWGFGQFLPVLLLALPIFAGWESFWEEKDKEHEKEVDRYGRKNHASQGSRTLLNGQESFELPKYANNSTVSNRHGYAVVEQTIEGDSRTSMHTPRQQSASHISLGSYATPNLARSPPMPSPAGSPYLGTLPQPRSRPQTPSRFEEQFDSTNYHARG
ncbi:hypothetical protein BS50DRAFT_591561 [Corynespora cassiicola Philippines]|uniref:Uncharacterized protein n=1 Tax=Corynespora cassiicola Philippines TaxID=1448308 RepID=A0A2T2NDF9_CORCC|nr:hypothetical protein BS50DRAFT_591561 [Corynespora cassiicola Philippines]